MNKKPCKCFEPSARSGSSLVRSNSMSEAGPIYTTDVVIPSDSAEARRVQEEIERLLKANAFTEHDIFGIRLALEEALVNAIKHGNNFDRNKNVRICYNVQPERFDIRITDEGKGFDPEDVPDPTAVENLERPCGRGLMLMRYYMSAVAFTRGGNSVCMTKLRNGKSSQ
jgi:serine/threonine-protein kinase RsbW